MVCYGMRVSATYRIRVFCYFKKICTYSNVFYLSVRALVYLVYAYRMQYTTVHRLCSKITRTVTAGKACSDISEETICVTNLQSHAKLGGGDADRKSAGFTSPQAPCQNRHCLYERRTSRISMTSRILNAKYKFSNLSKSVVTADNLFYARCRIVALRKSYIAISLLAISLK